MSRSYWLPILAVVGLTQAALGQAPNRERLSAPSPSIKEQPTHSPDAKTYPSEDAPLPIRIIESATDAKHTLAREARSDKYDAEDLKTQKRAADATEKQITTSWIAAFLSFGGTLLILWSLREARRANSLAKDALAQSERHARIGLRAYLSAKPADIVIVPIAKTADGKRIIEVQIIFSLANSGSTPARNIASGINILSILWPPAADAFVYKDTVTPTSYQEVGADSPNTQRFVKIIIVDPSAIKSGKERIIIVGSITYRDVWEYEHTIRVEGSLISVQAIMDACETYIPGSGPLTISEGAKFEWYHPDNKKKTLS